MVEGCIGGSITAVFVLFLLFRRRYCLPGVATAFGVVVVVLLRLTLMLTINVNDVVAAVVFVSIYIKLAVNPHH